MIMSTNFFLCLVDKHLFNEIVVLFGEFYPYCFITTESTSKVETMHEKIQKYQQEAERQSSGRPYRTRDKGAR